MIPGGLTVGTLRHGARLAASIAIVALSAACAIDVTEYTPFASGNDTTQVARDRKADAVMTASLPRTEPATAQRSAAPKSSAVVVARGDTLYGIARRHRTSVDRLAEANALQRPYVIRTGQRLVLPDGRPASVAPVSAPVRNGGIRQITEAPVKGGIRVSEGDTLYSIARRNHVSVDDLMTANAISDPARIRSGQVLVLPYQRVASARLPSAGSPEITGSIPAPTARRAPTAAEKAYNKVMRDFRVVPGQSILAPF